MRQVSSDNTDNYKKTILLAEDDAMLREVLRRIFERADFSTLVAEDGQEALRMATDYPDRIDLLVSDIQMPGMTGPELATVLRDSQPNLRVMLMSAYPRGVFMLNTGWSFLQKPFPPSVIVDKVQQILAFPLENHFAKYGEPRFVRKGKSLG
jgi:CheY-like chemotaxis protein